ncbi:MAG: bifunctional rhamnulose-1-phosphate aldolase/short-chain dehydrogenase [Chloroflexi bacterium]|nr:bifunctional rhamnulose-1-phosphate aldolase/short-chain dehydrogenase [Chloroflexota bacterium]
MKNRWNDPDAGSSPIEQLVYMSRLMGQDEGLVLWGGGNSSFKVDGQDLLGRPIQLMLIKGSGSDMKSVQARDFPAVRLEEIRASFTRADMTDDDMVAYLARCMVDPAAPRPSIETLLHGYLEAPAVAHSHADAILALTNTRAGVATVRRVLGESVAIVAYRRPGFLLAKEVALAVQNNPAVRGVVLMNHGLLTWGDTAREAYSRHIDLVSEAEEFTLAESATRGLTPAAASRLDESVRRSIAAQIAPALRGALSARGRKILRYDDSADILCFLDEPQTRDLVQIGPATPDHLLNTKRRPLYVKPVKLTGDSIVAAIREGLDQYIKDYVEYYERHRDQEPLLDPAPRVVLIPGLGMWTAGPDMRACVIPADIYHHTIGVIGGAEALDHYASLSEKDAFDAEYWPLELYKLTLAPPERQLARQVALVTGAAQGLGAAIAKRLALEGAHVVVTDLNETGAAAVASEIASTNGPGRAVATRLDVTDEESVRAAYEFARLTYGGLDILVSNAGVAHVSPIESLSLDLWEKSLAVNATGHFLVARETIHAFKEQGLGGAMVFVATKNVTAPGKDFGAYSAAKAAEAQLARVLAIEGGEYGIRANMVNPDAIFEGSGLWSDEVRRDRAAAHGIAEQELEDFYRQRNLLRARVTAEDVAEAVLWLASDRSSKTTGAMIPVDAGVREAFPR